MAATGATRRIDHRNSSTRRQADRRGRHTVATTVERPREAAPSTTPAMHITPNVVIAARGDAGPRSERRPRRTLQTSALDLHRFRA